LAWSALAADQRADRLRRRLGVKGAQAKDLGGEPRSAGGAGRGLLGGALLGGDPIAAARHRHGHQAVGAQRRQQHLEELA
jgi:hypothetical protein